MALFFVPFLPKMTWSQSFFLKSPKKPGKRKTKKTRQFWIKYNDRIKKGHVSNESKRK